MPGNSLIPPELEKATQARKNRYGVDGDNGYSEMVDSQLHKTGVSLKSDKESILNFTKEEAPSPPKEAIFKQLKKGNRKIVNARAPENV